jgi:hypothetical protein
MVISGYVAATMDQDKPRIYNAARSVFDAILTFGCLYAGGFYTNGIPRI